MTSTTMIPAPTSPLTRMSLPELRQRTSVKWRTHPEDVLPLWVAEMDVALAPSVAEALTTAISRGDTGYPAATHSYAEAVAAFAEDRWGWTGLAVERTTIVPDVMMGVVELLRLVSGPGDVVVVTPPVYAPFYAFTTHADRRVMEAPLTPEGRIDPAALEEAFTSARAVSEHPVFLLSNPHNPTGVAHSRAELETVAALARRHGVRVISDEIHAPLVLPGATFTPYLSVAGAEDAFALLSASKAWNLAGLKAALAVAGPEAADDLARMPEEVSHGPSHLGVMAHTAAFATATGWLDDTLAGLAHNRDLLGSLVREHLPTVRYTPPEATYLAWLDCADLRLESPTTTSSTSGLAIVTEVAGPARFFLDRARVALSSGHVFGASGSHHVRLNFATHPDILIDAVTRMGDALANHDLERG